MSLGQRGVETKRLLDEMHAGKNLSGRPTLIRRSVLFVWKDAFVRSLRVVRGPDIRVEIQIPDQRAGPHVLGFSSKTYYLSLGYDQRMRLQRLQYDRETCEDGPESHDPG